MYINQDPFDFPQRILKKKKIKKKFMETKLNLFGNK